MKRLSNLLIFASLLLPVIPAKADFGDADFPVEMFDSGPQSYHDAWCRRIKNKCRVRFQGRGMWVEGQGGIKRSQLKSYRIDEDGNEYYHYVGYESDTGQPKQALFLFTHREANREFMRAFINWQRQDASPTPNYRYPASQGPQETHGGDKSFGRNNNPYANPPITDWSETTQPW